MKPAYEYGNEVRLTRNVRNDGTYPGMEVGELIVKRGSIGCVYDVGTYLQDQLIYRVHFIEDGKVVGCREEELIPADAEWIPNKFEFRDRVKVCHTIKAGDQIIAEEGSYGEIQRVVREPGKMFYHVRFGDRIFQIPEQVLEADDTK